MSNQLWILMWKHLIHMRHSWLKLAVIYLTPILASSLVCWAVSTTVGQTVPECDYTSVPLLTLPAQFLEAKYLNSLLKVGTDKVCTNLPSNPQGVSMANLDLSSYIRLKRSLNNPQSQSNGTTVESPLRSLLCGERNKMIRYVDVPPMGFLLSSFIGYFPKTNETDLIMGNIADQLRSYQRQIVKFQSQPGLDNQTSLILKAMLQCWSDPSVRIVGFNSEPEATNYAQQLDFRWNLTWGLVNFRTINGVTFDYQLISHTGLEFSSVSLLLQDLLENSYIKRATSKQPVLIPQHKLIPRRCASDQRSFAQIELIIGLVIGFSFAITSAIFVGEIVYEKRAGLHEYLLVLGVSRWKLKLSWYLYGLILFSPVGLILAIITFNLPGEILVRIDWQLITLLYCLHTIAQLSFAYFLSTLIQTPTNSSTVAGVIYFVLHLAIVFTNISQLPKSGGSLIKARLGCIYCGTGVTICLAYMVEWSKRQTPLTYSNAFISPFELDNFAGVGEGLLWILGDIILYISLGWYFDKTMPRRYGLQLPFYFFLQRSYWTKSSPKNTVNSGNEEKKSDKNTKRTIVLSAEGLTKSYDSGESKSLDSFTLNLYQSELITLLGNNGAGKSTLINLLTGLISPTSGTVKVDKFDIRWDIAKVRQNLGFCPQGNEAVLYPGMTVEFHYKFYGYLRGFTRQTLEYLTEASLGDLDMTAARHQSVSRLSGGQRRKLSVAFAFLNNPKLVVLDEPTSSIDAVSKQKIWDVLLKRKSTANTILLSTHDMTESELLSDRVALMSKGHLIKVATVGQLVDQHGGAVRMIVNHTNDHPNRVFLMEFITSFIPLASKLSQAGQTTTVLIQLRACRTPIITTFLAEFDKHFRLLGVVSYRLVEPSLSDVFFSICCPKREELKLREAENCQKYIGWRLALSQLHGMLLKRFTLFRRSLMSVMFQFFIPIITVLLMVVGLNSNPQRTSTVHNSSISNDQSFFMSGSTIPLGNQISLALSGSQVQNGNCLANSLKLNSTCSTAKYYSTDKSSIGCLHRNTSYPQFATTRSYDLLFMVDSYNLTDWLLSSNTEMIAGGFELDELLVTGCYSNIYETFGYSYCSLNMPYTSLTTITLWSGSDAKRSAFMNLFNNLLLNATLQRIGGKTIVKSSKEAQLISNEPLNSSLAVTVSLALFLTLAITVITFPSLLVLVNERANGCKHLQLLSGLEKWIFWVGNLLWDLLSTLISLLLIMAVIFGFRNDFNNPNMAVLFLIMITYAISLTLLNYLLSFVFRAARHAIIVVLALQIAANVCSLVLQLFQDRIWFHSVNILLNLIPPYFCSDTIYNLGNYQLADLSDSDNYLAWDKLGENMAMAWATIALFIGILLLLETDFSHLPYAFCLRPKIQDEIESLEDNSVLKEIRRLQDDKLNDTLVIRNVSKIYSRRRYALKDMSFGVESGIFCLLGPNGAGKSTLMRILTKLTSTTGGEVTVAGRNLQSSRFFTNSSIGYCPQDDQLFTGLTPLEHLKIFGKIRGIASGETLNMAEEIMRILELPDKQSDKLSGGNRRKLNFAICIFTRPQFIYLDEAEKGMDISARDAVWRLTRTVANSGSTVVTITHHLSEAESQSARLAVLAAGKLQVIGSPKYIADRQSRSHLVKFYLKSATSEKLTHAITTHFKRSHPRCQIDRHSHNFLTVKLPIEDLNLRKLYRSLQELNDSVKEMPVYSVTQEPFEMVITKFFSPQ